MKNLLILIALLICMISNAQTNTNTSTKGELNTQTPTSKFVQGAFTGTALYIVSNSLQRGDNKWVSHTISILGSLLIESLNSKTNFEKGSFVLAGSVTINVTFEIFKGKKCNRHNY